MANALARSIFSSRYSYYAPYGDRICTYCGDPASVWDHAPPVSVMIMREETVPIASGRLVRACTDCNRRLGDCPSGRLRDRRARILGSIHRKFHKILAPIRWADDELEQLGPQMLAFVKAGMAQHAHLRARSNWLRRPPATSTAPLPEPKPPRVAPLRGIERLPPLTLVRVKVRTPPPAPAAPSKDEVAAERARIARAKPLRDAGRFGVWPNSQSRRYPCV